MCIDIDGPCWSIVKCFRTFRQRVDKWWFAKVRLTCFQQVIHGHGGLHGENLDPLFQFFNFLSFITYTFGAFFNGIERMNDR